MHHYAPEEVKKILKAETVAVYGARIVANEVANCLMSDYYGVKIDCFIVSSPEGNGKELLERPILPVEEAEKRLSPKTLIIIAVLEKYYDEIVDMLKAHGFNNTMKCTFESDLWQDIRGNYLLERYNKDGLNVARLEDLINNVDDGFLRDQTVTVYRAVSPFDRELREDMSGYSWEKPIQVGAALTEDRVCELTDSDGDNISLKNRRFCELTALYWIWKHDRSAMAGLCHYRRHFDLDDVSKRKLCSCDADVILTIPILNFPSVGSMYGSDHSEDDWKILKETVLQLYPEYSVSFDKLDGMNYYFAYNMFIARKEILDDYCEWMFPILFSCEEKIGDKSDIYQNRYAGFMAERLLSLYILHHSDTLKIAVVRKHFME